MSNPITNQEPKPLNYKAKELEIKNGERSQEAIVNQEPKGSVVNTILVNETKKIVDDSKTDVKKLLEKKADLVNGKVPEAQLPSYVDDVLEYEDLAHFPEEGETGKIYVALDTGYTYRWSGTEYILIGGQDLSNYVTTNTDQTITGKKTIKNTFSLSSPDGLTNKNIVLDNNGSIYVGDNELILGGGRMQTKELRPVTNDTYSLGSASLLWKDGYFSGQVISSNVREEVVIDLASPDSYDSVVVEGGVDVGVIELGLSKYRNKKIIIPAQDDNYYTKIKVFRTLGSFLTQLGVFNTYLDGVVELTNSNTMYINSQATANTNTTLVIDNYSGLVDVYITPNI